MKRAIRENRSFFYVSYFFILFASIRVSAQFHESGTTPSSVRWQQIHTENFRIIFPVDAANDGQRTANILEYIYLGGGKSLKNYPSKVPVVLHNRTSFSNGFVSWAPKRVEMFLTSPQDNYAQDWLSHLAVHEYRHVVQIDKLNQGITQAMGIVVGQQAVGAVASMLPRWFLEGDAVATETALTNTGRGRNPAFEMPLRTIALSEKYQKYDKALFGSYRDHVPNHYEFGYQMIAWTREQYGEKPFETAIDFVARKPYAFFLYPFKLGIKKETGYTTEKLYNHAFADLTSRWSKQEAETVYENIQPINKRSNNLYTSYRSPQYLNDTDFVTLKTGIAQIAELVMIDVNGNEQKLHTPGILNSDRFSYSKGIIAWTEHVQDARWSNRTYSVVKLYDAQTGKERMLQRRTRFFAPAISPDGATLAVVEVTIEGACSILLLDTSTGEEIMRLPNTTEAFLQTPAWSRDGKSLLVIVNDSNGKSIARIDIASGLYTVLLPPSFYDISYPVDGGEGDRYVFFTAYYNGITNIYAVDYLTGAIMQVTSSRFGAFDPQPNESGDKMIYAEYSVRGYDIVETDLSTAKWTLVDQITDNSLKLYEALSQQENFNMQDSIIPNIQYSVKPYNKWSNLFNIHSWAPLYYEIDTNDPAGTEFYPGIVLFSQDLLGNLTSTAGYSWRGYNAFNAGLTFKGLYPVFDFKINYGGRFNVFGTPLEGTEFSFDNRRKRTNIDARAYIPFNLTRSRWITGITPQVRLLYDNRYIYLPEKNSYQSGMYRLNYSFLFYRYQKTSLRDLAPRLGIMAQSSYLYAPWNEQFGNIYFLYARAYLPGVARHHSLRIAGAWQHETPTHYLLGSMLSFPRGYIREEYGATEKLKLATLDYSLPLCYPDWNVGFLFYLKRLHANLFCDVAQNNYRTRRSVWVKDELYSVGVDLFADVNILRINFPFNIGIRTAYVPETGNYRQTLMFSVDFY